ncbi:hypothetical protein RHECNPAF_1740041 [Rhizobium etli CNPAF512]|nr:hypothetical protein RHECNPAF_1740041 [Rhizobium etli CNPAF512]
MEWGKGPAHSGLQNQCCTCFGNRDRSGPTVFLGDTTARFLSRNNQRSATGRLFGALVSRHLLITQPASRPSAAPIALTPASCRRGWRVGAKYCRYSMATAPVISSAATSFHCLG